jgi:hypothetical protein
MDIKLKGFSNFNLNIIKFFNNYYIKKTGDNENDINKLKRQIEKQKNFITEHPNIIIPKIKFQIDNGCIMDFINNDSFYEYFISVYNTNHFFKIITEYIDNNLLNSKLYNFSEDFGKKIFSKHYEILKNPYCKSYILDINNIYNTLNDFIIKNEIIIPKGKSHGDLTLSNIIYDNKNIYFIDFLDDFIDTPLQDIIKLRQDTQFFWSYLINKDIIKEKLNKIERNILITNIKILDNLLDNYYKKNEVYIKYYNFYQMFNFYRILPYSKSFKDINIIMKCINNIKIDL